MDACSTVLGVECATFDEAYIKASNAGTNDFFGSAVAMSGDTLAVGAYGERSTTSGDQSDDLLEDAGAVYVFVRDGAGVWSQQAYLKREIPEPGDLFGVTIALEGDTLAVGATGVNELSGVVYVFQRDGSEWALEDSLTASNGNSTDVFGCSVSLSGGTLAVGARNEDSNATGIDGDQANDDASESGAVYVFERGGAGTWTQEAYIKAENTGEGDRFGGRVALEGDVLAVGAYTESSSATGIDGDDSDDGAERSGAVYVFHRGGTGSWSQEAYIKASNTDSGDNFGYGLALSKRAVVRLASRGPERARREW